MLIATVAAVTKRISGSPSSGFAARSRSSSAVVRWTKRGQAEVEDEEEVAADDDLQRPDAGRPSRRQAP